MTSQPSGLSGSRHPRLKALILAVLLAAFISLGFTATDKSAPSGGAYKYCGGYFLVFCRASRPLSFEVGGQGAARTNQLRLRLVCNPQAVAVQAKFTEPQRVDVMVGPNSARTSEKSLYQQMEGSARCSVTARLLPTKGQGSPKLFVTWIHR